MCEIMENASRAVTGGLTVRTDVKIVRWPDRYMDKRGKGMWDKVISLLSAWVHLHRVPTSENLSFSPAIRSHQPSHE